MPSSIRSFEALRGGKQSREKQSSKTSPVSERPLPEKLPYQIPAYSANHPTMDLDSGESDPSSLEDQRLTRYVDRGAPGDKAIFSDGKTPEQREMAKRKSQYYGDVFAYREPNSSARERISRESIIMADVRTNVIVHDEYTFITDLSYNLSNRYQRPESCILVTVTHSACLLFGGSFEPAYVITLTAIPSQVQPATNKRNAALVQKMMEEALGVSPARGLVKFSAVAEANLATNGRTVLGEIEELEREQAEDNGGNGAAVVAGLARGLSRRASRSTKRQSTKSMRNLKSSASLTGRLTPPASDGDAPPMPPVPASEPAAAADARSEKMAKMGRRKSFMATVFGR